MADNKQVTPMTPSQMAAKMAEQEALIAKLSSKLAEAEAAATGTTREVNAIVKRYGKGTVSIENVNRFPISLHPAQLPKLSKGLGIAKTLLSDVAVQNDLRCAGYAYEYAMAATGRKGKKGTAGEIPMAPSGDNTPSPERQKWQDTWDAGYAIALADPTAKPESKKYVDPATVYAAWQ